MAATLEITDDTTTINLIGGDGYSLLYGAWSPQRAQRRIGEMAGRSLYEDVTEEIVIAIRGDSMAQIMERYGALSDLLDQAEAWVKDDAWNSAVKIKYQPDGSTLAAPLEAVIVGPSQSGRMIEAPFTTNESGYRGGLLSPITLRFVRRGLWLGATEFEDGGPSTGNPALITSAAFTDDFGIFVPFDARIDLLVGSTFELDNCNAFFLFSDQADKLYYEEAEDHESTGGTDTALTNSSGGNVVRVDSSGDTNEKEVYSHGSPSINSSVRSIALWVAARNRSPSTVDWTIHGQVYSDQALIIPYSLPIGSKTTIASGDNNIKMVYLGIFNVPNTIRQILILAKNNVTGTVTTDDLDIDYVCGVSLDDATKIVYTPTLETLADDTPELWIEHQLDSKPGPRLYTRKTDGSLRNYPAYQGDILLQTKGDLISCLAFGHLNNSTVEWTLVDANADEIDVSFRVTRTTGYLTPL
jgi:hypothetical protein